MQSWSIHSTINMASSRKEDVHDFPDPAAYTRLKHKREFLKLRKRSLLVGLM